jgi:hypothetical protein
MFIWVSERDALTDETRTSLTIGESRWIKAMTVTPVMESRLSQAYGFGTTILILFRLIRRNSPLKKVVTDCFGAPILPRPSIQRFGMKCLMVKAKGQA